MNTNSDINMNNNNHASPSLGSKEVQKGGKDREKEAQQSSENADMMLWMQLQGQDDTLWVLEHDEDLWLTQEMMLGE